MSKKQCDIGLSDEGFDINTATLPFEYYWPFQFQYTMLFCYDLNEGKYTFCRSIHHKKQFRISGSENDMSVGHAK